MAGRLHREVCSRRTRWCRMYMQCIRLALGMDRSRKDPSLRGGLSFAHGVQLSPPIDWWRVILAGRRR